MARVGFIGAGSFMARNLIRAGHGLKVFDVSEEAMNFAV
jgi:3-hydroxyisobutyrate dehydrogenase-like beta-hydroxyacid dehydrogenase